MTEDNLLTQTQARRQARQLNAEGRNPAGTAYVAHAVPVGAWGGHEKGWTVSLISTANVGGNG